MAIYTRWGSQVIIVKDHGKVEAPWISSASVRLVTVRFEDNSLQFYFTIGLRANDGINEIEAATDAAPKAKLNKEELAKAMAEAI
jgi:hypothetical protein